VPARTNQVRGTVLIHIRDADGRLGRFKAELEGRLPNDEIVWLDPSTQGGLQGVDVFIRPKFTTADGRSADSLRLVQVTAAGLDDTELSAIPSGAMCANLYRHEHSIAEYAVTAAALLRRGFLTQDAALRRGVWLRPIGNNGIPIPSGVSSARIGLIGFGHIGRSCWRLFKAFGATIGYAVSGSGSADRDLDGLTWWGGLDRLDELFESSDVVVVALPDTAQTRGLVGAHHLELLGPTGLLINVGRGPVVQPAALYDALAKRRIAGAAIDVWYQYPTDENPRLPAEQDLGSLDNVLMTPHMSGVSTETYQARVGDIIDNIERVRIGLPPINRVK